MRQSAVRASRQPPATAAPFTAATRGFLSANRSVRRVEKSTM